MAASGEVIVLRPSRMLARGLVVLCAGATVLALIYLPSGAGIAISVVVLALGYRDVQCHALLTHATSITALQWAADEMQIQRKDGAWSLAIAQKGGLVSRWLTVVRLRVEGEPVWNGALVLLPDKIDNDSYRRFRVHLLWRWRDAADRTPLA